MSEPARGSGSPTAVTIFGRTYHLLGEDGDYMEEIAAVVDHKMREAAEATGSPDTVKVAVLASLNLADDYLKACRGGTSLETQEVRRRLDRMVALLDEALAG
jgi:cell division protein ZapA